VKDLKRLPARKQRRRAVWGRRWKIFSANLQIAVVSICAAFAWLVRGLKSRPSGHASLSGKRRVLQIVLPEFRKGVEDGIPACRPEATLTSQSRPGIICALGSGVRLLSPGWEARL